jgi:hypothetical protein
MGARTPKLLIQVVRPVTRPGPDRPGGGSGPAPECSRRAANAARHHGCSLEVWLGTKSMITRMSQLVRLRMSASAVGERAEHRFDTALVRHVVARAQQHRVDRIGASGGCRPRTPLLALPCR